MPGSLRRRIPLRQRRSHVDLRLHDGSAGGGILMAAAPSAAPSAAAGRPEPRHGLRIFVLWLVAALVADLLIWFVWGPHMPPGAMSSSAAGQQSDLTVMSVMAAPVLLFVLIYFGYALVVWRQRDGDEEDGPPIHGNTRISAIWTPGGSPLQVQVIAQQWIFTYRYPQFGGVETTQLVLPQGQNVQFNVTSLDVIHSFWAYQLGVKADANPELNNVAYTKPEHLGAFRVRCAELCGLFHGAMTNVGRVETPAQFQAWGNSTEARLADVTKMLPPYATIYDPAVIPKIGQALVQLGITGAGGGYFPPQNPGNGP